MKDSEARLEAARLALHDRRKTEWPPELTRGYMHAALVHALCKAEEESTEAATVMLHTLDKIILLAGLPACKRQIHLLIGMIQEWLDKKDLSDYLSMSRRRQLDSFKITAQEHNESWRYERPPSLMSFKRDHMDPGTPCVIEGALSHWPALGKHCWRDLVPIILNFGRDRLVPVEIGGKYTQEDWTQTLMPLREFLARYIEPETPSEPLGYIAQHALQEQAPDLLRDFFVPDYCALHPNDGIASHFWLGPAGTVSPPHTDPRDNLFAQVVGAKEVLLWPPGANMYPFPYGSMLSNTSQVDDPYAVDKSSFPEFSLDGAMRVIMKPGDLLYIPRGWWHYVK